MQSPKLGGLIGAIRPMDECEFCSGLVVRKMYAHARVGCDPEPTPPPQAARERTAAMARAPAAMILISVSPSVRGTGPAWADAAIAATPPSTARNAAVVHGLAPFGLRLPPVNVGAMPNRGQSRFVRIAIRITNGRNTEGRVALLVQGNPRFPPALQEARAQSLMTVRAPLLARPAYSPSGIGPSLVPVLCGADNDRKGRRAIGERQRGQAQ